MNIATLVIYTLGIFAIGLLFVRKQLTFKQFALGSQNYTTAVLFVTLSATLIGGNSIIVLINCTYAFGITNLFVVQATALSSLLVAYLLIPRMAPFIGSISIGDIIRKNYGKHGQILCGVLSFLFCAFVVGFQIKVLGYLLGDLLDLRPFWITILCIATLIIYSSLGGIRSVTFTDIIQFIFLVILIPTLFNLTINEFSTVDVLFSKSAQNHINFFPEQSTIGASIVSFFALLVPFLYPPVLQRIFMSKNVAQAKSAFSLLAIFLAFFYLITSLTALALFAHNPDLKPDDAFPYIIKNLLQPYWFKHIVILGILAAITSTADSFINSGSIALVQDIIKPLRKKSKNYKYDDLTLARTGSFFLGTTVAIISLFPFNSLEELSYTPLSFWLSTITFPLIATILGFKIRTTGFYLSIIAGTFTSCYLRFFWGFPNSLTPELFGFLANLTVFTSFALFNKSFFVQARLLRRSVYKIIPKFTINFRALHKLVPTPAKLLKFSHDRAQIHRPLYRSFGVFIIFTFSTPIFLWSYNTANIDIALTLRIIGGFLASILLLKDAFPQPFKKFLPLLWQFTVLFCLPFIATYSFVSSELSPWWTLDIAIAFILGSLILDTLSFILIFTVGILTGYLFSYALHGPATIAIDFPSLYIWIFCTLIGFVFSRIRDMIYLKSELSRMQALGATIAHEMRTPLATASLAADNLKNILPELLQPSPAPLCSKKISSLNTIPALLNRSTQSALTNIDILLNNVQASNFKTHMQTLYIKDIIHNTLEEYPFTESQKALINLEVSHNFSLNANPDLLKHVLFNLIKNALYSIQDADKGEIYISTEPAFSHNTLLFKDTGTGIPQKQLKYIFNRFYSNKKSGSGLGLWFCKQVLESFNAHIQCKSQVTHHATFTLSFPKA